MRCPACGVAAAAADQTFCADCGAALPRDATPVGSAVFPSVPSLPDDAPMAGNQVPEAPAAGSPVPSMTAPAAPAASAPEPTEPPVVRTMVLEQVAGPMHVDPRGPMRLTPALLAAVVTAAVVVLGLVLPFVRVEVSGSAFDDLQLGVNDVSSNLLVTLVLAAVLAIGGAAIASTSRAWGRGLCLGAAGTLAAQLALVAGGGALVLDEQVVRWRTTPGTYQVITTYGPGYVVLLVALLGALVSAALAIPGLRSEPTESHTGLAAVAGVLGGVGAVAAAVGPLLPGPGGSLLDNLNAPDWPPFSLWMRLVSIVVMLGLGLVGALVGRRWSWGVLSAVVVVSVWLDATALGGFGDQPFGLALGQIAIDPADPFTPHALTSAGVGAMTVAVLLGSLAALSHHRPTHD
jgi:hypothetical protein